MILVYLNKPRGFYNYIEWRDKWFYVLMPLSLPLEVTSPNPSISPLSGTQPLWTQYWPLHNPNFPPNHPIYKSTLHLFQVFPHELLIFIHMYSVSWFAYANYIIPCINSPPLDKKVYVLEYLSRKVTTQRNSYIFNPIATYNHEIMKSCYFFESPPLKKYP